MDKFRNKYRIPSARAQWWDYSNAGAYFITICTAHRTCFFGEIVTSTDVETRFIASLQPTRLTASLQPTRSGELAIQFWRQITKQFNFIELGPFVVMPNHVHGILVINDPVETRLIASIPATAVQTQKTGGITGQKNPMLNENISRAVRWYKGRCTFEMRKTNTNFGWQPLFHDHIIRDDEEYLRISNYIETNPVNWENDKFN